MSRRSTYGKLHAEENLNLWEWKAQGNSHLVAVPLPGHEGELYSLRGRRPFYGVNAISALIFIVSALALSGVGGFPLGESNTKAIAGVMIFLVPFLFLFLNFRVAKKADTSPLYRQRIPWAVKDKHNPALVPRLNAYSSAYAGSLNFNKWRMAQGNDSMPREEYEQDTEMLHRGLFYRIDKGWNMMKYVTIKNNVAIINQCDESYRIKVRPKLISLEPKEIEAQSIAPRQLTGSLATASQETTASSSSPLAIPNADPLDKNAPRGKEVLSFYEGLQGQGYAVKQLTTAVKRWSEISRRDRDNLVLLMDELAPMLKVLGEAKALEREELLTKAEKALGENLAVAEEVAERINSSVDQSHLDSISISSTFLRDKFHSTPVTVEKLLER